jgi:hypothetical protein
VSFSSDPSGPIELLSARLTSRPRSRAAAATASFTAPSSVAATTRTGSVRAIHASTPSGVGRARTRAISPSAVSSASQSRPSSNSGLTTTTRASAAKRPAFRAPTGPPPKTSTVSPVKS